MNSVKQGFWKRHLDKIGVGGSLFAALCCLGFPALLAILSAVGLGFLIHDAVLIPMLVAFLALTLYGLYHGMQRHRRPQALGVGAAASLVLFASIWFGSSIAAGIGIAALIASSLLNVWFAARPAR
ncbi:MAG: MerC domain-containing protein [Betaproteobacteria bacterium]|nr:MerC domain-containing protein [Betaproteobacteria bacterium]